MGANLQYTEAMLAGMQAAYGEGFLSPGGAADMRRLLSTVEVEAKHVLDFGCGVGGATIMFASEFAACHVTSADPEPQALQQTAGRVAAAGLEDQVTTVQISPGPLPFPDRNFDIAYSKDVICHIADKEALFHEMHRVLTPGGMAVLGDWTIGAEKAGKEVLAIFVEQLAAGGLNFHFEQAAKYKKALYSAGFVQVEIDDISPVFLAGAAEELAKLLSADQVKLPQVLGVDGAARRIALTQARHDAILAGGLAYHHVRART